MRAARRAPPTCTSVDRMWSARSACSQGRIASPCGSRSRAASITSRRSVMKARSSDSGPEAGRPCMPRIGCAERADIRQVEQQRAPARAADAPCLPGSRPRCAQPSRVSAMRWRTASGRHARQVVHQSRARGSRAHRLPRCRRRRRGPCPSAAGRTRRRSGAARRGPAASRDASGDEIQQHVRRLRPVHRAQRIVIGAAHARAVQQQVELGEGRAGGGAVGEDLHVAPRLRAHRRAGGGGRR